MADKRNIEFTEDQLRRSSNTVGLQYEGSFKHDTGLNASREVVKVKDPGLRGATTQQMGGSIAYGSGASISNNIVKVLPSTHTPGSGLRQETGSGDSTLDDLERLAELRDAQVITEEEFQEKKNAILGL